MLPPHKLQRKLDNSLMCPPQICSKLKTNYIFTIMIWIIHNHEGRDLDFIQISHQASRSCHCTPYKNAYSNVVTLVALLAVPTPGLKRAHKCRDDFEI